MKTILVIDDEKMIRESVSSYLTKQGYTVLTAENGNDVFSLLSENDVSLIVLDLMLPDMSGEEICVKIRQKSNIPIIMLTAKTMEEDMLNGLKIGADDYITKPFSLREMAARVEVVLRRSEQRETAASVLTWNDLTVDLFNRTVQKSGQHIELTHSEWNILEVLCKHPTRIYTRDELLDIAFGIDFDGFNRVIDTHIKNLRKKIEDDTRNPVYILTVHGIGYRFGGNK